MCNGAEAATAMVGHLMVSPRRYGGVVFGGQFYLFYLSIYLSINVKTRLKNEVPSNINTWFAGAAISTAFCA